MAGAVWAYGNDAARHLQGSRQLYGSRQSATPRPAGGLTALKEIADLRLPSAPMALTTAVATDRLGRDAAALSPWTCLSPDRARR